MELADPHPAWDLYDEGGMEYEQLDAVVFGSKLIFPLSRMCMEPSSGSLTGPPPGPNS